MSRPTGRRAGMAILSIELDSADPERVLVRVKTVDDTLAGDRPVDRAFADVHAALAHLRGWIEAWPPDTG